MALFFAPVVEEAVFRMLPLTFVLGRNRDKVRAVVIVICGIFFGAAHWRLMPFSVFIQGFTGIMLGRLYIKNANSQLTSYFSCVLCHALFNFTVMMLP